jgi:hypothetical protein
MRASDAKYHSPFSYAAMQAGYVYLGRCLRWCKRVGGCNVWGVFKLLCCCPCALAGSSAWSCYPFNSISLQCLPQGGTPECSTDLLDTCCLVLTAGGKMDDVTVLVSYVAQPSKL